MTVEKAGITLDKALRAQPFRHALNWSVIVVKATKL
jgi:hypothetical protein